MPNIFWTGDLSFSIKLMMNFNGAVAWLLKEMNDVESMKKRIRRGFEGVSSSLLWRYDELGGPNYERIARALIEDEKVEGKKIMDMGCGTGILAFALLEKGASQVVCADNCKRMLSDCKEKADNLGLDQRRIEYRMIDAEAIPIGNDSFDAVYSSMLFALLPYPERALSEMRSVAKPGATIGVAAQGPGHYREFIEAGARALSFKHKMKFLGYRPEYWPFTEKRLKKLFWQVELHQTRTRTMTWTDEFASGSEAFDYYAATSGLWGLNYLSEKERDEVAAATREYFEKKKIKRVTHDVVLAIGEK